MKLLQKLSIVSLALIVLIFISCEKEEIHSQTLDELVVGKWEMTYSSLEILDIDTSLFTRKYDVEFFADKTGLRIQEGFAQPEKFDWYISRDESIFMFVSHSYSNWAEDRIYLCEGNFTFEVKDENFFKFNRIIQEPHTHPDTGHFHSEISWYTLER